MTTAQPISTPTSNDALTGALQEILDRQRQAFREEGPPSRKTRLDRLDRAIGLLVDHENDIVEALSRDFSHRSLDQSRFTDVAASIEPLKFARKNLRRWMRPEKRKVQFPMGLLGAKARVEVQPLGVVGVLSPWNFPVNLTFAPLAGILAAGNRSMIKPSEHTPATSELMKSMIESAFDETEIAVVLGGPEVGQAFAHLPFDHLLFTGGTRIAYHIMRAAADNLVPVTLELGGKSPVVIGQGTDLDDAANKIMAGKLMNAGQICLAPDYVLIPEKEAPDLVAAIRRAVDRMYGGLVENPDYTSLLSDRHLERLTSWVEDARQKGAEVVEINPRNESFDDQSTHKMPPILVLRPTDEMKVLQEEIFGPVLPIKTYRSLDEAIEYINDHPRPLALYYFGHDAAEQERVLSRTTSGGVTVNDVVMHVTQEDLPFGGVGPSGMGSYHGYDGFKTFSHARAVFTQSRLDLSAMVRPPYGDKLRRLVRWQIRR